MTYYSLPSVSIKINPSNLKVQFKNNNTKHINKTLSKYLNCIKKKISGCNNSWDNMKKYTNPYEYIHTPHPSNKHPISKIKPLSRAFFKFIEICNVFNILEPYKNKLKSFHLAEGPGGFIEAMLYMRLNNEDTYYGMTLVDGTNFNVPGWSKSKAFLKKHSNIIIERGVDDTGNLYNPDNFKHCVETYGNTMDVITGDGGFDFSVDFNKQETLAFRLIMSQVAYAIGMQKYKGSFILKIFDTFMKPSVDILYILSTFYESVSIMKPQTSRYANSEKYVICKNFKFHNTMVISQKFFNIICVLDNMGSANISISTILNVPINHRYLSSLEEINAIFGQQQIENILLTLRFIENKEKKGERLQQLTTKHIQKCIAWCVQNNIPYNKYTTVGNIFLNGANKKIKYG